LCGATVFAETGKSKQIETKTLNSKTPMKTFFHITLAAMILSLSPVSSVWAQEEKAKPEFSVGADLVSSYVWRGVYQSGASLQPAVGLEYCGFSIGAWGSTTLDASDFKELDLSLGYSVAGFSVGVTDYFWAGESTPFFSGYKSSHLLEATLGYDFGEKTDFPLWLSWSTFLAGDLDVVEDKRKYSTYIEAGYAFSIGSVDMTASVGVAPWDSPAWLVAPSDTPFKSGFQVSAVTLGAFESVKISDEYSIGLFANLIVSPARDGAHLVVGVSF
jgi:hypothetical protein